MMMARTQEVEEMKEWKLLEEYVNDGTSGEITFTLPCASDEVMILLEYNGSISLTNAWEIFSVNGSGRIGIINMAPTAPGKQLFKIQKTPFGFMLTGTKSVAYTFVGSANGIYYNLISSNDEGIEKFSFGSDNGKAASSKDVIWKIYYR